MVNFDAFELLHKKYSRDEMPFLTEMREWAHKNKPYQNLKILHNIPLTLEAVLKIEILLLAGAKVTASCVSFLSPSEEAIQILKKANVPIQINHDFKNTYDFCLDCCGELALIKPTRGVVELTQTGSEIYKKMQCNYSILSIDDSKLKFLETLYGTGDGFIRALTFLDNEELYNKGFMIFGYGKVGKGIAHALIKFTDNITVIDIDDTALKLAAKKGLKVFNAKDKNKIKNILKKTYCVVTASGIKNLMSTYYGFIKSDFGNAILTNMGANDEYGIHFEENDVLFQKKPLNFSIPEPTTIKYLDPILYAHNLGTYLILSGQTAIGYNPFPDHIALSILNKWADYHKENLPYIEEYIT